MTTTLTTEESYKMADEQDDPASLPIDPALDGLDSRSSSLSELDEANDAQPMTSPTLAHSNLDSNLDNDSEAETERLDQITPKARRATLSDGKFSSEKTPSRLSRQIDIDSDIEEDGSPIPTAREDKIEHTHDEDDVLSSSEIEASPKKRKRASTDGSPLSDAMDLDEPARKRPHADEDDENDDEIDEPIVEELPEPDEGDEALDDEAELDAEDNAEEILAEETPAEEARLSKPTKGRRGKRKGRKIKDADAEADPTSAEDGILPDAEGEDAPDAEGEAEAEAEEDDSGVVDEERKLRAQSLQCNILTSTTVAKKKAAMDGLASIEKYFLIFRKK